MDVVSVYILHGDASLEEILELFDAARNKCFIGVEFNGHHGLWNQDARANIAGKSIARTVSERPEICLLTPNETLTWFDPSTGPFFTIDLSFASSSVASNYSSRMGPYMGSDHFPVMIELDIAPKRAQRRELTWLFDDLKLKIVERHPIFLPL